MGGSYGGYMTLAAASSFIYAKFGDPKDPADAAYQHDRSPIHFIDEIQRPRWWCRARTTRA